MTRHVLRFLLVFVLATLCAAATPSVYAKDGPKEEAYGAFTTAYDEATDTSESFHYLRLKAPHKGFFYTYSVSGKYAGSWQQIEVGELFFGTYQGASEDLKGLPVVYYWGEIVADEEYLNGDFSQDYEGWFRVGGFFDGGPGYENDVMTHFWPIPPEGLPWFCEMSGGLFCTGKEQARELFNYIVNGNDFGRLLPTSGNINIKIKAQ